jgi:hypothetical protein
MAGVYTLSVLLLFLQTELEPKWSYLGKHITSLLYDLLSIFIEMPSIVLCIVPALHTVYTVCVLSVVQSAVLTLYSASLQSYNLLLCTCCAHTLRANIDCTLICTYLYLCKPESVKRGWLPNYKLMQRDTNYLSNWTNGICDETWYAMGYKQRPVEPQPRWVSLASCILSIIAHCNIVVASTIIC